MRKYKFILTSFFSLLLVGCACPNSYIVKPIQKNDKQLSCKDITLEINEVEYLQKQATVDKEFDLNDFFFPLCYGPSYLSANKAIRAADERVTYLQEVYVLNKCDQKTSGQKRPAVFRGAPPPGARPLPPGARPIPPGARPLPPGARPIPPGARPVRPIPQNFRPAPGRFTPPAQSAYKVPTNRSASAPKKVKKSAAQKQIGKGLPPLQPLPKAGTTPPPLQGYTLTPPPRYTGEETTKSN